MGYKIPKNDDNKIIIWKEDELVLLKNLLDEIIPASPDGRLPGAGALGIVDFLKQQVKKISSLDKLFSQGLAKGTALLKMRSGNKKLEELPAKERIRLVKELEKSEPDFFAALIRNTYMGYYTNPTVPPYFGLSDKPPQPNGYEMLPDDPKELDKLIEPVRKRGKCFREC
jgi:hypothetical protein